MTGRRCTVYDKIDALGEARTVPDLVTRLKPILNDLAYYAVTGEGAVMEAHEEWHTTFTDRLYEATGAAAQGAGTTPAPSPRGGVPHRSREQRQGARRGRADGSPSAPGDGRDGVARRQLPPPGNRPRPEAVTPALLAIMTGTHESLHEDDGPV